MKNTETQAGQTVPLDSLVRQECSKDELPCNGCYYRTDGGGPCAAPSVLPCWIVEDDVQHRFIKPNAKIIGGIPHAESDC